MSWISDLLHSTLKAQPSDADLSGDKFEQAQKDYGCKVPGEGGNEDGGTPAPDFLFRSRRTLTFAGANTNIRLTLPYEGEETVYKVTCKQVEGSDVAVTITDWTTSTVIHADETAYIRLPAGDKSTGKITIFAVYPGTQHGTYELIVERTDETDAYTGEIQVDFAAAAAG